MTGNCGTCRWWQIGWGIPAPNPYRDGYASCGRIEPEYPDDSVKVLPLAITLPVTMPYDYPDEQPALWTLPDFGCVLYEEKK